MKLWLGQENVKASILALSTREIKYGVIGVFATIKSQDRGRNLCLEIESQQLENARFKMLRRKYSSSNFCNITSVDNFINLLTL